MNRSAWDRFSDREPDVELTREQEGWFNEGAEARGKGKKLDSNPFRTMAEFNPLSKLAAHFWAMGWHDEAAREREAKNKLG